MQLNETFLNSCSGSEKQSTVYYTTLMPYIKYFPQLIADNLWSIYL